MRKSFFIRRAGRVCPLFFITGFLQRTAITPVALFQRESLVKRIGNVDEGEGENYYNES
ncbi:MAG: hypothetical protein LUD48_02020 [Prevotella sp.]|nr:hypothetical protein [Prevotella sp.]